MVRQGRSQQSGQQPQSKQKRESPYLLLPYQQKWIADNSPVKVCEKSRRIGISWAEAADDALLAAQEEDGDDVFYIGYNEDMARLWIEDVANWVRHYKLAADAIDQVLVKDEDKDILAFQIRFASGHKIMALSSRPSNLRGKQGKIVIDEAAFHPDLPGLLKAAIALLIWGSQIVIISTHDGIDNAFNQLINAILSGKKKYSLHKYTIDDALNDGLYKRICLVGGEDWSPTKQEEWRQELFESYGEDANEELLCIPRSGGEVYFPSTLVEARMNSQFPVLRLSLPNEFAIDTELNRKIFVQKWINEHLKPLVYFISPGSKCYFGMDFGRTNDLTVIAPVVETQKLKRECPFLVELRNCPIRQQEQILYYLVDNFPNFVAGAMDARGNGQAIAEFTQQRYGVNRIDAVMLTPDKYREIVPRYKTALEDNNFLMPKDADIIADHRSVRLENGVPKVPDTARVKGSDGCYRHGDSFIALAFGYYAASQNAGMSAAPFIRAANGSDRATVRDFFYNNDNEPRTSRRDVRGIFG
jgi:phage FluMu gp28-like protein